MRSHIIQTNFTSGEITPKLAGRVDLARYANAAKMAENVTSVIQGGLRRRDGLRFVYRAKYPDKKVRLIPWVFSREQSYVLEIGDGYIRLYQSGKIVEDVTDPANPKPYEIPTIIGEKLLDRLTYCQGADTMFFAHPDMRPQMLQRKPKVPGSSQDEWECVPLTFTPIPADARDANSTPLGWLLPDAVGPVGKVINLKLQESDTDPSYNQGGFSLNDVGKYISINGGMVKIETVAADHKSATGKIRSVLSATTIAPEGSWEVQDDMWSDALGWPGCVALFQQRLLLAGSRSYPQTIWGSAIRDYTNFELGYADDAAYSFQLDSDQINPITSLFATNALIAQTHSGEFLIGGANNTITPTNINVRVPSNFGSSLVRPVRVGTELMFVQRAGRKLLAISYDPQGQASYEIGDISVLAEHMTSARVSIVDACWQQEPESLLRLVTSDGALITVAYSKGSEVNAWTRNHTGAVYNDDDEIVSWDKITAVTSIPTTSGEDACYVAVRRTINGQTHTYIEMFSSGLNVDSGLTGQVIAGQAFKDTWGALDHLEGKTVDVVADGVPMVPQRVTGGQIKLPRAASHVDIGLPYRSTIKTFKPEFQTPIGTPQGGKVSSVNVTVRLLNSIGLTINGDPVPFRHYGKKILDQPPELFTGDIDWQLSGWDNNEILIEQRQPLPFHLLAIIRTITVN